MQHKDDSQSLPPQITFARAAVEELLGDFLELMRDDFSADRECAALLAQLQEYESIAVVPTLARLIGERTGPQRVVASALLSAAIADDPTMPCDPILVDEAHCVLRDAVESRDEALVGLACIMLSTHAVPICLPALRRLAMSDDPILRVMAATALSGDEQSRSLVVPLLREAAEDEGDFVARLGMLGLLRVDVHAELAQAAFARTVTARRGDSSIFAHLLSVRALRRRASSMAGPVAALAASMSVSGAVRGAALSTLGHIADQPEAYRDVIILALECGDTDVVTGALEAASALKLHDDGCVRAVVALLRAEDWRIRLAAIRALAAVPILPPLAAAVLLERLLGEPHVDVLECVASVLARCADVSPAALIAMVESRDVRQTVGGTLGLVKMRERGAIALADRLASCRDPMVVASLIVVLRDMGNSAVPAIDSLQRVVLTTDSDEIAHAAIMAIMGTGVELARALPSLVHAVLHRNDQTAGLAQQALWRLGPPARSALRLAAKSATPWQRVRIDQTLSGISTPSASRFRQLQDFGNDAAIRRVAAVGHLLLKHGPMPLEAVADQLRRNRSRGLVDESVCVGGTTLGLALRAMEKHFGGQHIVVREGSRAGDLSPFGRRLIGLIDRYLAHLRAQGAITP